MIERLKKLNVERLIGKETQTKSFSFLDRSNSIAWCWIDLKDTIVYRLEDLLEHKVHGVVREYVGRVIEHRFPRLRNYAPIRKILNY
mgnify:FL=1